MVGEHGNGKSVYGTAKAAVSYHDRSAFHGVGSPGRARKRDRADNYAHGKHADRIYSRQKRVQKKLLSRIKLGDSRSLPI